MRFGVMLVTQDPPRGERLVERWRQLLAVSVAAEEAGFDGVFVPEHHMAEDGCLPSPFVGLAAIASRTSRIDLGTAACLLPFHHPIRIAEDAAMVDVISDGRMRLGCGLGNMDVGAALFGADRETQAERLEEAIALVRLAWTGAPFEHAGPHYRAAGTVTPRPVAAQLWLAGMSAPGARRAARLGLTWLSDPLHNTAVVSAWAAAYRTQGEESGTTSDLGVVMIRDGWVADDLDAVEQDWWPHARNDFAGRLAYFQAVPKAVAERDPVIASTATEDDLDFGRHRADRLVVGSPADCIEQIRALDEAVSMDYLIMRLRMPSGPAFAQELECIRRFGAEVIPAFR